MVCHEKEEDEFTWFTGEQHVQKYLETAPKVGSRVGAQRIAAAAKAPPPPRPKLSSVPRSAPPATAPPPPPPKVEKAPLATGSDADLASLLEGVDCDHLMSGPLASTALADLLKLSRPELLAQLKELGVSKLPERQKIAGAVAKAASGVAAKQKKSMEADYIIIGGGTALEVPTPATESEGDRSQTSPPGLLAPPPSASPQPVADGSCRLPAGCASDPAVADDAVVDRAPCPCRVGAPLEDWWDANGAEGGSHLVAGRPVRAPQA